MKWMRRLLVLTILGLLGLYPLLAPPAHRIDPAHGDRIKPGMTRQQVEGIFGVPAGEYDWAEAQSQKLWSYAVRARTGYRLQVQRMQDVSVNYVVELSQQPAVKEVVVAAPVHTTIRLRTARNTPATWTSRHGTFTVWFNEDGRVVSTGYSTDVKIVPPWQRWWRTYSGQ